MDSDDEPEIMEATMNISAMVRDSGDHANDLAIICIQKRFNSRVKFQKAGRTLLMQGNLIKISRKSSQLRYFILFTDILVYANVLIGGRLSKPRIFKIDETQVKDIEEDAATESEPHKLFYRQLKNGISICTKHKSFVVTAETPQLKSKWLAKLNVAIAKTPNTSGTEAIPPVWIPDKAMDKCVHCNRDFQPLLRRQHHCRQCGIVVCSDCSKSRRLLDYISNTEPARICRKCDMDRVMPASSSNSVPENVTDVPEVGILDTDINELQSLDTPLLPSIIIDVDNQHAWLGGADRFAADDTVPDDDWPNIITGSK